MPNLKKLLVAVIMIFVSLLLLSQFHISDQIFEPSQPSTNEVANRPPKAKKNPSTWKQLKVLVNLPSISFIQLRQLNQSFIDNNGIYVELVNAENPLTGAEWFSQLKQEDSADIMLTDSASVLSFAKKGWLQPIDQSSNAGFTSLAWLMNQLKWNGYTWGVPAQIEPYVLVWNKALMAGRMNGSLPESWEGWKKMLDPTSLQDSIPSQRQEVSETDRAAARLEMPRAWFAWHSGDREAFLSLIRRLGLIWPEVNQTPLMRSDWYAKGVDGDNGASTGLKWNQQLIELESYRSHFVPWEAKANKSETWNLLRSGKVAFAIVPYSEAVAEVSEPLAIEAPGDVHLPVGQWVASRSYIIASSSQHEAEARQWIAYMTSLAVQREWYDTLSVLPVHEQAYIDRWGDIRRWLPDMFLPQANYAAALFNAIDPIRGWIGTAELWLMGAATNEQLQQGWNNPASISR